MSRRYPSNAEPIQFLQADEDVAHALAQGGESPTISRALGTMGDPICIRTAPAVRVMSSVVRSEAGGADEDPLRTALLIANAIRQAVYGGDGPLGRPIIGEGKR